VRLPDKLFLTTGIPACIFILSKNRDGKDGIHRERTNEILFIDASKMGTMESRKLRVFTDEDINKVTDTYHVWRNAKKDDTVTLSAVEGSQTEIDVNYIALVVGLIKERATFVSDFWDLSAFFFGAPSAYDEKASKKALKEDTVELMTKVIEIVTVTKDFTVENLQAKLKGWITDNNIGFGKVMMPLRLALVGALQGPDVFDIMFMIGKVETINRIEALIKSMN
jgi:glutamyl-tRNA synthetase